MKRDMVRALPLVVLFLPALPALPACGGELGISGVPGGRPLDPVARTQIFEQPFERAVDVLWVIDNSRSMEPHQSALASNLSRFVPVFRTPNLDLRVGVVTTDAAMERGALRESDGRRWIDGSTPDHDAAFRTLAQVGADAETQETGLWSTWLALGVEAQEGGANDGFLRPDSVLHTVIVSDEDDQTPTYVTDAFDLVGWYRGLRDLPEDAVLHAVVEDSAWGYLDAAEALGGTRADIQADDWGEVLDALEAQMAAPRTRFPLEERPTRGSVEVQLVENDERVYVGEDRDWTYNRTDNAVVFVVAPNPGAVITVDYLVDPAE